MICNIYIDKLTKLEETDAKTATNLAALFSDDGRGMSADFISDAMQGDQFNKAAIENLLSKAGFTVEEAATAVGKTVEDFWKEAEDNARKAQITNKKTFE